MGNTISSDYTDPDIWWSTPHTNKEQIIDSPQTNENKHESEVKLNENILSECKLTKRDLNLAHTSAETSQIENSTEHNSVRRRRNEEKLQQFRSELEKKHLARREAIAERSREILFLRSELAKYKKENENFQTLLKEKTDSDGTNRVSERRCLAQEDREKLDNFAKENLELRNEIQELKDDLRRSEELINQNTELRVDIATAQKDLQSVNAQMLEFEKERDDYKAHVVALKDVIHVSKKLLEIRENQLKELKSKIADIEASLAEHEASMLSSNLKNEYERQLKNMRALRTLYEERQAATKAEKDLVASQLSDMKKGLEDEQKKNSELQERVDELESNVSGKFDKIINLESQLGLAKAEYRGLEAEMSVINQLFSQILLSFNNDQGIDLDKLIKLLEENHDLLTNIVINEESEAMSSALPKVLLDLINRVNSANEFSGDENSQLEVLSAEIDENMQEENLQIEPQINNQINSAEEIVNKLPKVWRVLIELLSQQGGLQQVNITDEDSDPCYKSIQTPKGPKLVLSVSKTFIRLKDLILEKKSLEKEMMRLKHLNTHLEGRLQDQEKRLELVSSELSKTWHVVGRMQRQHQQLHTHEKVLRYELAEKRKMLTELKDELEYCREKWVQAREKNSSTEEEWKKLRLEFASRKATVADDSNNSAESGYSDERECSSDDDASFSLDEKSKTTTDDGDGKELSSLSDSDVELIAKESDLPTNQLSTETAIGSSQDVSTAQLDVNESVLVVPQDSTLEVELEKTESTAQKENTTAPKCISLDEIDFDNTSDPKTSSVTNTEATGSGQSSSSTGRSSEEMLAKREIRLKRLEEQCKQLVTKVTNTSNKSTEICSRLETLHEQYGNEETERK